MLDQVLSIVRTSFSFDKFEEVGLYFRKLINMLKQMNYVAFKSESFHGYEQQLFEALREKSVQEESVQTA
jgi:V/A-type H+-transporting ATPase subunit A